jgi:spore maturation protein A
MLNYIWAGLVIFSLVFALSYDIDDFRTDRYRNGAPLAVRITVPAGADASVGSLPVTVTLDAETYAKHFRVKDQVPTTMPATLTNTPRGRELRFEPSAPLPAMLATIRDQTIGADKPLRATVKTWEPAPAATKAASDATLQFAPVRWVKLKAITAGAFNAAKAAVLDVAFPLIGVLSLWLGLSRIAEKAGLIELVVRMVQPILRPLFPGIPRGHPAMGMIALNLTANVLGLGNAATPFGIKAMEQLQTLNPRGDTATNDMVMFLAMNTAGVQIVPPVLLFAVIGMRAVDLIVPIWICTFLSLCVAVAMAKLLGMLPAYRRSDPHVAVPPSTLEPAATE